MHLSAHFEEIGDLASLGARWRALEQAARPKSFFLRWTWMGSWLSAMREAGMLLPELMVIEGRHGTDEGLALIGSGIAQRMFGAVPALWLNEAGGADADRPFIEYNGLLCAPEQMPLAVHAFCEALSGRNDWAVLYLSGLGFGALLTEVPGVRRRIIRDASPAYFADLKAVREAGGGYLSLLSANTRGQIRRSLKDEPGELVVEVATDWAQAGDWLAEMQRLNISHHTDNAWDNHFFLDFVYRIMRAGLADGTVELQRIASEGTTIGYLLNFVWAGRAMNYQSAFAQPRTAKSKPGLMCHTAAVAHYATRDLTLYSFLAGKDRYKHSLSTGAEELHWWALERFDWRLEAEAMLRRIFRR